MLLLHLLALLPTTVVIVVVTVSVVCTIAVAVAVIVTGMYPLSTHGMTVVIAMDNVAAVLLLLFVSPLFPHSIVTVTALESGRSPHGGSQQILATGDGAHSSA